ncbi:4316_t:CDS:2, partial [Gigaspora rosea]
PDEHRFVLKLVLFLPVNFIDKFIRIIDKMIKFYSNNFPYCNYFSELEDQEVDMDGSSFITFLQEIENNYENSGPITNASIRNSATIRVQSESVK